MIIITRVSELPLRRIFILAPGREEMGMELGRKPFEAGSGAQNPCNASLRLTREIAPGLRESTKSQLIISCAVFGRERDKGQPGRIDLRRKAEQSPP